MRVITIILLGLLGIIDINIFKHSIILLSKYLKLEWEGKFKVKYAWKVNILTILLVFVIIDGISIIIFLNENIKELFKTQSNIGLFIGILWRFVVWRILSYWSKHKDLVYNLIKS